LPVNRRSIHGPPNSPGGRLMPCITIRSVTLPAGRASRCGLNTWRTPSSRPVATCTRRPNVSSDLAARCLRCYTVAARAGITTKKTSERIMPIAKRLGAEFLGTFWLVLGGCGSAVLAAAFPGLGIGFAGVAIAFGLTVLTGAYAFGHISGA